MKLYDVIPIYEKSFYGKAKAAINDDGSKSLYSYGTLICTRNTDGTITRHWPYRQAEWTHTTGRHIGAFCGLKKSEFMKLSLN